MKTAIIVAVFWIITMGSVNGGVIYPIIPLPRVYQEQEGSFALTPQTRLILQSTRLRSEAELFNEFLVKNYGFPLRIVYRSAGGEGVSLTSPNDAELDPEGYMLSVKRGGIVLSGSKTGIFYGLQTLQQLLSIDAKGKVEVPCVEIEDGPRYTWRGMHLDVGRHFFPKEFIKKYIDYLAMYKMNTFHWHLTDDQGWRIEIKKYPRLTEVGAWRNGSMIGPYSQQKYDSIRYGGYYTQREIKEIVAYAAKRHVTIVPEIEMPGHSLAALASYPSLSCTGGPFEVEKGWGVFDDVYCPKEETFTFLENVLTEVCALFPGKYIHIGGDECPKERWKKCEYCQALMKKENLKDEDELQSYFIRRIEKFVNSKGKQIIGWDEILEGGLAPNAAVMSWRGTEGGITAAKQSHYVVMTPGSHCYFDYYQGNPRYEPNAIGGYIPVEKVYSYEPTPPELLAEERQYILGAQGNVWTEYITTPSEVEYMTMPRMAALAEVVWSPKEGRNYAGFTQRLLNHFKLLDKMGVNYARAIFDVQTNVQPAPSGTGILLALSSAFDSSGIRFTVDGSEPSAASLRYVAPLSISRSITVKAAYYEGGTQRGNTVAMQLLISKSTGKKVMLKTPPHQTYPGNGPFTLVDGIKGDTAVFSRDWLGWQGQNMDAVIDLGRAEKISRVSLDFFRGEGSWIYPPKGIEVLISDDGIHFKSVKKLVKEEIGQMGNVVEMNIGNQTARYIKVIAEHAGKILEGKPGAGNDAWVFIDEIMVE